MRASRTARGFGCGNTTASAADQKLQYSNCRAPQVHAPGLGADPESPSTQKDRGTKPTERVGFEVCCGLQTARPQGYWKWRADSRDAVPGLHHRRAWDLRSPAIPLDALLGLIIAYDPGSREGVLAERVLPDSLIPRVCSESPDTLELERIADPAATPAWVRGAGKE